MIRYMLFLLVFLLSCSGQIIPPSTKNTVPKTVVTNKKILISTTKGDIVAIIYVKQSPDIALDFIKLAESHFYDNMNFFRIINGKKPYIVQTGDPSVFISKSTLGFSSGPIHKKVVSNPLRHGYGYIALAADPLSNMLSTQFYFLLSDAFFLDGKDTVIGEVIEGIKVVKSLTSDDKILEIKILSN